MTSDLVLYDSAISGNAYKVRLLLSHLGLKFERIEFNVDDGSTRTADFLAKGFDRTRLITRFIHGPCFGCYLTERG